MGGVWHQAGCCCGPCSFCTGATPADFTMVISGWSLDCSCAFLNGSYYTIEWDIAAEINQSHTIPFASEFLGSCFWFKIVDVAEGDAVRKQYSDASCLIETDSVALPASTIVYTVQRNATKYVYRIASHINVLELFLSGDLGIGDGDCTSPPSPIANTGDCAISSGPISLNISTTGTATVTI